MRRKKVRRRPNYPREGGKPNKRQDEEDAQAEEWGGTGTETRRLRREILDASGEILH